MTALVTGGANGIGFVFLFVTHLLCFYLSGIYVLWNVLVMP